MRAVDGSSSVKNAIESTHLNLNLMRELIITNGTLPTKNTGAKFSLHQLFLYRFGFFSEVFWFSHFCPLFPLERKELGGKEVGEGRENESDPPLH